MFQNRWAKFEMNFALKSAAIFKNFSAPGGAAQAAGPKDQKSRFCPTIMILLHLFGARVKFGALYARTNNRNDQAAAVVDVVIN